MAESKNNKVNWQKFGAIASVLGFAYLILKDQLKNDGIFDFGGLGGGASGFPSRSGGGGANSTSVGIDAPNTVNELIDEELTKKAQASRQLTAQYWQARPDLMEPMGNLVSKGLIGIDYSLNAFVDAWKQAPEYMANRDRVISTPQTTWKDTARPLTESKKSMLTPSGTVTTTDQAKAIAQQNAAKYPNYPVNKKSATTVYGTPNNSWSSYNKPAPGQRTGIIYPGQPTRPINRVGIIPA